MKLLCKGGWVGRVKATLLSLAIEFSLVVGATVGISFLLRVAQLNESEFELTMRLAEGGDTTAQWNLGVMYDTGVGVPQDYKEAVKWYTKAAEQGDVDAQNNLGAMFDNGEGVPKDLVQAYAWYDVANANGQEKAKDWRDKIELTPLQLAEAQSLYTEIYKRIEANRQD